MRFSTLFVALLASEAIEAKEGGGGFFRSKTVPPPPPTKRGFFGSSSSTASSLNVKGGTTKVKKQKTATKPAVDTKKKVVVTPQVVAPPPPKKVEPTKQKSLEVVPPIKHEPSYYAKGRADTTKFFQEDVLKVLKELRSPRYDPTVSGSFHSQIRPTFAVTWTHKLWEMHTSRWRFVHAFVFWHKSALLKRVIPQLTGLMIWTYVAIRIVENRTTMATLLKLKEVKFPMTSLSLVSGFVASLLALRSNQGLARLMEGRTLFGKVVMYSRDMASLMKHFVYGHDKTLALKMARHVAVYSWLMRNFLRGQKVSGSDEDLIRTMLPKADADYILSQRKMPVAVVMRLRQALAHLSHDHALTTAEELAIDHTIQGMDQVIMLTEKLVASPIPPLFTSHAGRLLVFYLFFLPLALHSTGSLNMLGTMVTVFAVGYAMLGLDEISHLMEQPFRYAPLWHLCKNSMRDVADAFCIPEPSLSDAKNLKYEAPPTPLAYWGTRSGLEGI